jgi:hypothetical protein
MKLCLKTANKVFGELSEPTQRKNKTQMGFWTVGATTLMRSPANNLVGYASVCRSKRKKTCDLK